MSKTKHEFLIFGMIGVLNTLIHAGIVIISVEYFFLNPILGNIMAFFMANILSFFMNCKYTFQIQPSVSVYKKFFLASLIALGSIFSLSTIAEILEWHYLIGLMLVIIISPVLTFILQKLWTFKSENI
jgi:putative flippase GtrA